MKLDSSEEMSRALRIAVAGVGLIGKRHVKATRYVEGMEVSAIVDPLPASREFAATHGIDWYGSLDDLFASNCPDGVIVATPNQVHVENGLTCIKARCPMLIEKPIAFNSDEAACLVDAGNKAQVPILVGHHRRHNPVIRKAKAILEGDGVGRIVSVHATCWLSKPADYFDALWRKKKGAGPVLVNAIHDIDLLRHLCGEIDSVQAIASNSVRSRVLEDSAVAVLQFASGALGTLNISDTIASPWSWELTASENNAYAATGQSCYVIGGTRGSLSIPDNRLWSHGPEGHWMSPIQATSFPSNSDNSLVAQLKHFRDVIAGEQQPLVSGAEGVKSLCVAEAILQSAGSGQPVHLNSSVGPADQPTRSESSQAASLEPTA